MGFRPGDRVAGYFRDSGGDDQDRSITEQKLEWLRECEQRGLIPFAEFEEQAKSARSVAKRKAFQKMIEYFEQGQAQADGVRGLLIWSFSRFARQQDDFQFYIASLRRQGFIVESMTDAIPAGNFSRLFEAFVSWKDAQYSEDLSKNIRRGQELVLNNYRSDGGLYELPTGERVQLTGGGVPPVGYERYSVITGKNRRGESRTNAYWKKTTNPDLAGRVRRAWELILTGASYAEIERECKLNINPNSYNDFFTTIAYTGTYTYGDFRREGAFEAYVSHEDYARVQQIIESRLRPSDRAKLNKHRLNRARPYLLTGGMLRCGKCGSPAYGSRSTKRGRSDIYYYECSTRSQLKRTPCGAPKIRADELEPLVIETLLENLDGDNFTKLLQRMAKRQAERQSFSTDHAQQIETLKQEIKSYSAKIQNLIGELTTTAVELGIVEDVKLAIGEAKRRRDELQKELENQQKIIELPLDRVQPNRARLNKLCELLKEFSDGGETRVQLAREVLALLETEVILYPDTSQIALTFNMSGVLQTTYGEADEGEMSADKPQRAWGVSVARSDIIRAGLQKRPKAK